MKKIVFILLILLFLILNCSDNNSSDLDNPSNLSGAFISAQINNHEFIATASDFDFSTIDSELNESNLFFVFSIGATVVNGNSFTQGQVMVLLLTGVDFSQVEDGFEIIISETNEDDLLQFAAAYETSDANGGGDTNFEQIPNEGFFKITQIDKISRIVSGEFSFSVVEENSNTVYQITQGVFNDISYNVEE